MDYSGIELADSKHCTACRACIQVCPQKCISLNKDEFEGLYATINTDECIKCGQCKRVCHLEKDFFFDKSNEVYAGWSKNDFIRENSASGGIASEIYRFALGKDYHCYGVNYSSHKGVFFTELKTEKDLSGARNSKYVFSSTEDSYLSIKDQLSNHQKVLFIGLPCQVAGLKSFCGKEWQQNLTTIDIICHGTCPADYLEQHINSIEAVKHIYSDSVEFRCPEFGTETFTFALKEGNKIVYHKGVYEDDLYQIGYHGALTYREACYNCKYARNERVGDLTISDFSGLGKIERWNYNSSNHVSMIIVSSPKGYKLLDALGREGLLFYEKRPSDEAFLFEQQLMHPSIPNTKREIFLNHYKSTRNFEKAAREALSDNVRKNMLKKKLGFDKIKSWIKLIIPQSAWRKIKKWKSS